MNGRAHRLTRTHPLLHLGIVRRHAHIVIRKIITGTSYHTHDAVVHPMTSAPDTSQANEYLELVACCPKDQRTARDQNKRNDEIAQAYGNLDKLSKIECETSQSLPEA